MKKEVIRILPPPIPINWDKISPVYSIVEIKEIDGEKYIAVSTRSQLVYIKFRETNI